MDHSVTCRKLVYCQVANRALPCYDQNKAFLCFVDIMMTKFLLKFSVSNNLLNIRNPSVPMQTE